MFRFTKLLMHCQLKSESGKKKQSEPINLWTDRFAFGWSKNTNKSAIQSKVFASLSICLMHI